MDKQAIISELGTMSSTLNGVAGRLIVAATRDAVVKEAHAMTLELGWNVDDLINQLLEEEEENV